MRRIAQRPVKIVAGIVVAPAPTQQHTRHRRRILASIDAARAAKEATASIPIIFVTGADPVASGLVSSINRPGGNVTGVSFYDVPITGKRLELLRQLVPKAEIIAVLQDPNFAVRQAETREIKTAARNLGQKIIAFEAGSEEKIDSAYNSLVHPRRPPH